MKIEWAGELEKETLEGELATERSPAPEACKAARDLESPGVRAALGVVAGKWKPRILAVLEGPPLRYGMLLRRIPSASRKVLTDHLHDLERDGIVARTVYGGKATHVEYSLSSYGRTLIPVLGILAEWGERHLQAHSSSGLPGLRPFPSPVESLDHESERVCGAARLARPDFT